jgi:hypothetical protein
MPATSKKQYRFMKAVEAGDLKVPGLSPKKAAEFTATQSPRNLPESARRGNRTTTKQVPDWRIG